MQRNILLIFNNIEKFKIKDYRRTVCLVYLHLCFAVRGEVPITISIGTKYLETQRKPLNIILCYINVQIII